jgi:hypothetical protein
MTGFILGIWTPLSTVSIPASWRTVPDIANAAREHLVLELTAQVTREIGNPVIPGRPDEISGRTGVQGGGSARAHVRVVVDVTVNVNRLTADVLKQARRVGPATPWATPPPAAVPSGPAPKTSRAGPAPADQAAHAMRSGVTV